MLATSATSVAKESRQATVYFVDDDEDVRRSVSLLVHSVNLKIEAYASPQVFLEKFDPEAPGCLVLDLRLSGMTGLQLHKHLRDRQIKIPTIMLSAYAEIATVVEAMRSGVLDFMTKPFSPQALLQRINEAIAHDIECREDAAAAKEFRMLLAELTKREQEVCKLLTVGKNSKQISSNLGISTKTVDNHRASVFSKMQVQNAAELVHRFHQYVR